MFFPALFQNLEKVPQFWKKKCRNYIHLRVKFLIYKAAVSVIRKKISEIFSFGAFLSFVADYVFIEGGETFY